MEGKRGFVCFQTPNMFRLFVQRIFPHLPGSDARGIRYRSNYEVYSISPLDLLAADGVRHSRAEQRFTGGWGATCHQRFHGAGGFQYQLEGIQYIQSESLSFSLSPLSLSLFLSQAPQATDSELEDSMEMPALLSELPDRALVIDYHGQKVGVMASQMNI